MQLTAGDIASAHQSAEAAAGIPVPYELFEPQPDRILDEIEFVTSRERAASESMVPGSSPGNGIALTSALQPVPPAPVPYDDDGALPDDARADGTAADAPLSEVTDSPTGWHALGEHTLNIQPKLVDREGERQLIPQRGSAKKRAQVPQVFHSVGHSRPWPKLSYSWEPTRLKHNPLYFEDAQLERYGNRVCGLQPVLSGVRFYATLPTLPYQMMSEGNSLCHTVYDLGHERPGDGVPYAVQVPPFSWTGALATGGWAYALVVILP